MARPRATGAAKAAPGAQEATEGGAAKAPRGANKAAKSAKPAKAARAAKAAKSPKPANAARKAGEGAAPKRASRTDARSARDKFLQGQLRALQEERATYTRQAASLRAEADLLVAEREPGDVQFDEESGEGDTLAVERERDLALSAQASAAVEEIDRAIERIHDGSYGVCERCGKDIPRERLRALPHAALCVTCKSAGFSYR